MQYRGKNSTIIFVGYSMRIATYIPLVKRRTHVPFAAAGEALEQLAKLFLLPALKQLKPALAAIL